MTQLRLLEGVLLLSAGLCGPASATNLLTNPGFETGDFTGWTVTGNAASGVATTSTPLSSDLSGDVLAQVRTGTYAAYNIPAVLNYLGTTLSQTIAVTPNTTYRIGFFYTTPGVVVRAHLSIYVDGNLLSLNADFSSSSSWAEISTTFTTGPAQTTATVSYDLTGSGLGTAVFCYDDFYVQPLPYTVAPLYDSNRAVKLGAVIPLKLQFLDASGTNVSSPSLVVSAAGFVKQDSQPDGTLTDAGNANPDSNFRYDPTLQGYVFNLKTTSLAAGTWYLTFTVNGQAAPNYQLIFNVK